MTAHVFTLFTVPKPFRGHIGLIQENAIRSWTLLGAAHEVILFGDEEGIAEVAERLGVRHDPEIRCSKYGTPFVTSAFERAQRLATHDWLCYVNTDIVLMSDLPRAVQRASRLRRPVLVSGRRWRLEVDQPLDFGAGWEDRLRRQVHEEGIRDSVQCMDYFLFPRGLVPRFPKFALGRGRWDSYLPHLVRSRGALFVDATDVVMAVHQNHDYALVGGEIGNRSRAVKKSSPEGVLNAQLVPRGERSTLGNADRKLSRWRLKRTIDHERLRYWVWEHRHRLVARSVARKLFRRHKVAVKRFLVG